MKETDTPNRFQVTGIFAAWLISWTTLQTTLLMYYGVSFSLALIDSLLTQGCLIADGYIEIMMVRYYRPTGRNSFYLLISSSTFQLLRLKDFAEFVEHARL